MSAVKRKPAAKAKPVIGNVPDSSTADDGSVVSVRVLPPYQVGIGGRVSGPGETLEVDPATAAAWVASGWVEAV